MEKLIHCGVDNENLMSQIKGKKNKTEIDQFFQISHVQTLEIFNPIKGNVLITSRTFNLAVFFLFGKTFFFKVF